MGLPQNAALRSLCGALTPQRSPRTERSGLSAHRARVSIRGGCGCPRHGLLPDSCGLSAARGAGGPCTFEPPCDSCSRTFAGICLSKYFWWLLCRICFRVLALSLQKKKKKNPTQANRRCKHLGSHTDLQRTLEIRDSPQTATVFLEIRKYLEFLHVLPACTSERGSWESFRNALREDPLCG